MERITKRDELLNLAKRLGIGGDWLTTRPVIHMSSHGKVSNDTGNWGREAEGDAAVGIIPSDAVEQYIVIRLGTEGTPVAELSLASLLNWASSHDPGIINELSVVRNLSDARLTALNEAAKRELAGDAAEPDPVLTWPVWEEYEDESNCAEYRTLRCMARVPAGNKILPGGKPQGRACRAPIDSENVLDIVTFLKAHIVAVEHLPPAE